MARVLIDETTLKAMGDAIRAKTNSTAKMTLSEMVGKVASITSGEVRNVGTLNQSFVLDVRQSANQTITADITNYRLVKEDTYNGFKLSTDFDVATSITANEGYTAGTVKVSQNGNLIVVSATPAISDKPIDVDSDWITYWTADENTIFKIVKGVREQIIEPAVIGDKVVLDFGNATTVFLGLDFSPVKAALLKLGDITRLVSGDIITRDLTIAKQHQIQVLNLSTNELNSINANGHSIIFDAREVPNPKPLLDAFLKNQNNSNSRIILKIGDDEGVVDINMQTSTVADLLAERPDLKGLI